MQSEKIQTILCAIENAREEFKPLNKSGVNNFFKHKMVNLINLVH